MEWKKEQIGMVSWIGREEMPGLSRKIPPGAAHFPSAADQPHSPSLFLLSLCLCVSVSKFLYII